MMSELAFGAVLAAAVATGAGGARAKPSKLSPEQVRDAIRWGSTANDADLQQYLIKVAPTWTANFDTPFLRVAQLARAWKKMKRQLQESHVPPGAIEPVVHVYALALLQPGVTENVKSLRHVTIRVPGAHDSIQPIFVRTNLNRARKPKDFSPAKIAKSVEAVFSTRDFAAGNELRLEFEGGDSERLAITPEMLATAR